MNTILFELVCVKTTFMRLLHDLLSSKGRIINDEDYITVDRIYSDVVKTLAENIVTSVKNKQIVESVIDAVNYSDDQWLDNLVFLIHTNFGILIETEKIVDFIHLIENSLLSDIFSNIPDVENDKILINDFKFYSGNTMSISYSLKQ